jgi:hypothetical protein
MATVLEGLFLGGGGWWRVVNAVFDVAVGRQSFRSGDKNGGMKSHDQEVQRMSKTAAKTAGNSVKYPGN